MSSPAEELAAVAPTEASRSDSVAAWWMCAFSVLGVAVCSSPVALITVGLFIKPFGALYAWNRASVSLATSIGALALAASTPVAGRLIDRFGVRPVLVGSLLGYGALLAAVPWAMHIGGLGGLYVLYVLIGALSAGSNTVAYARLLSGWFNRTRGLALGIGMSGIPLGMAITPPLAEYLIEHAGWPSAFVGLAALPLLVGLPLALFLLREAPAAPVVAAQPAVPLPGITRQEAMRGRPFWTLLAIFLLFAAAMNGIEIHIVALLGDRGFPAMVGAWVLSLINIVAIGARVGAGYLFDRLFAPRVAALLFAMPLVSTLLLLLSHAPPVAYVAAVLFGFGVGAESDLLAYLTGRYFGLRAYGELFGWIFGAFMVGTAMGPTLFGLSYYTYGNYGLPLTCSVGVFVLVCTLLASMPRYDR